MGIERYIKNNWFKNCINDFKTDTNLYDGMLYIRTNKKNEYNFHLLEINFEQSTKNNYNVKIFCGVKITLVYPISTKNNYNVEIALYNESDIKMWMDFLKHIDTNNKFEVCVCFKGVDGIAVHKIKTADFMHIIQESKKINNKANIIVASFEFYALEKDIKRKE